MDKVFDNEMNALITKSFAAYENCVYMDVLKYAWFGMETLRKQYCNWSKDDWHPECIQRFLRVQVLLLSPICPHICEHIWTAVLKEEVEFASAAWPQESAPFDTVLARQFAVLEKDLREFRLAKEQVIKERGAWGVAFRLVVVLCMWPRVWCGLLSRFWP